MFASTPDVAHASLEQEMPLLPAEAAPSSGVWLESIPDFVPLDQAARWQPILRGLGPKIAAEFLWAVTTDTIETYEHRETSRYLHIDGHTGEFLNQQCETISAEAALEHARRPAMAKAKPSPEPEPVLEAFAEDESRVTEAAVASNPAVLEEPFRDAAPEPALNAFTRKHGLDPDARFWGTLATKVDSLQSGLTGRLNLFADVKQKLLARAPGWRSAGFPGGHDAAMGSGTAPDSQQPTFAAFTRRTSAL